MRFLVAIKSCLKDKNAGYHQAIRETWGKTLPDSVDLIFFIGGEVPTNLEKDEICLPVPDGYWELHPKMLAIAKYAVQMDYDFSILCDTDTYLDLPKLMSSGFDSYDYSGVCANPAGTVFGKAYPGRKTEDYNNFIISPFYSYLSGGHGYILSLKAAKIVAASLLEEYNSEDLVVGQILGPFIVSGEIIAKVLPNLKDVTFHLACGYHGGGGANSQPELMTNHNIVPNRKDIAAALREKHKQLENSMVNL